MKKCCLVSLLFCAALFADSPSPDKAEMDATRLALIPARMKEFVDRKAISGAVTLIERHGVIAELDAVGWRDIENKKPMAKDTIFQIMSMTKNITGVAAMMLVDEGKLVLGDPVEKYLPEFRGLKMADGAKPSRLITVRDLMTHTAGLPAMSPGDVWHQTLKESVLLTSQQGLDFQPGTKWQYSNGGLNSLGRIVEVVGDQPFERFVESRILKPLGMNDSFFFPPENKYDRIAIVYDRKNGALVRGDKDLYRKGMKNPMPAGGMYSTAEDMAKFYQMMLNGGSSGGTRLLSKAAVEVSTRLHTGDIEPAGHAPGMGYGLTWTIVKDPIATLDLRSKGTYGHGGAFGTQGWVDKAKDMIGVFMIQRSSGGSDKEVEVMRQIAAGAIQ